MNYIDKLIFLDEHYEKAQKIYDYINPLLTFTEKQVSISGKPGSGKSEISFILQRMFADNEMFAKVFHLDEYYKVEPEDRCEVRKVNDVVGIKEIDWSMLARHTQGHFHSHYNVLIIEGLYAINALGNNFNILIKGNASDTLDFRIARGKENTLDPFRRYVVGKEAEEVERLMMENDVNLCI